ncbi:MAG: hypothetical protein ACKO7B_16140 [Flavobacteriales bacterium]
MKKQSLKFLIAAVTSLGCWVIIDRLIIDISFVKYLLIEVVITIAKKLYEGQLKQVFREKEKA